MHLWADWPLAYLPYYKVMPSVSFKIITFIGKHKPIYHPLMDCGDFVIVTNVKNLFLTGNKAKDGVYRWHTGYRGGLKERGMPEMLSKDPTQVIACHHIY